MDVSYNYITADDVRMREYHLDTHKAFGDFASANNKQYGGDLSVRLRIGEHPVLLVGQDESIFHQYIFSKKQWRGPNGKAFLMPKSEGEMYMASGFTAREFGLGLESRLTPAMRTEINESHRRKKILHVDGRRITRQEVNHQEGLQRFVRPKSCLLQNWSST
jgi:hypothetical protein